MIWIVVIEHSRRSSVRLFNDAIQYICFVEKFSAKERWIKTIRKNILIVIIKRTIGHGCLGVYFFKSNGCKLVLPVSPRKTPPAEENLARLSEMVQARIANVSPSAMRPRFMMPPPSYKAWLRSKTQFTKRGVMGCLPHSGRWGSRQVKQAPPP